MLAWERLSSIRGERDEPPSSDANGTFFYWDKRSEPHTCGENGKLFIYTVYICIIYVCLVRAYSVYAFCPICA